MGLSVAKDGPGFDGTMTLLFVFLIFVVIIIVIGKIAVLVEVLVVIFFLDVVIFLIIFIGFVGNRIQSDRVRLRDLQFRLALRTT
jgi:hypothetical protein